MRTLEFDFKYNPFDAKERCKTIRDQIFKAYVFLNEQVKAAQLIQVESALTNEKAEIKHMSPVIDFTIELSGDELKFLLDAVDKEYARRF